MILVVHLLNNFSSDGYLNFAIFGMIGSIASSAIGNRTQKNANKANLKINQMNNEFNAAEAEKARKFQEYMYDKQWANESEYNSAAAQRERLEEAGYNPYMSDASAGTASGGSAPGAAQATASSPGFAQAFKPDLQLSFADALLKLKQAKGQDIQNSNLQDLLRSQINKNLGDTDWFNTSEAGKRFAQAAGLDYMQGKLDDLRQQWTNRRQENRLQLAKEADLNLDVKAKGIMNKYLDEKEQQELQLRAANYFLINAKTTEAEKNAQKAVEEALLLKAKTTGQHLSNKIVKDTAKAYVRAMNNAYEYQGDLDFYARQYSKEEAGYAVKARRIKARMDQIQLEQDEFSNRMKAWREALNSADHIIHGAGQLYEMFKLPMPKPKMFRRSRRNRTDGYDEYYEYD